MVYDLQVGLFGVLLVVSFQLYNLVDGFNPVEKYDRQNGNLPQV